MTANVHALSARDLQFLWTFSNFIAADGFGVAAIPLSHFVWHLGIVRSPCRDVWRLRRHTWYLRPRIRNSQTTVTKHMPRTSVLFCAASFYNSSVMNTLFQDAAKKNCHFLHCKTYCFLAVKNGNSSVTIALFFFDVVKITLRLNVVCVAL